MRAARILATARLGAEGYLLELGNTAHTTWVVVAADVAIDIIVIIVVAVTGVAAIFIIVLPRTGRTSARAKDVGVSVGECAIWPGTASLGWFLGL